MILENTFWDYLSDSANRERMINITSDDAMTIGIIWPNDRSKSRSDSDPNTL
jgi:hypothetical protein